MRFNSGNELSYEFRKTIREHFEYKWDNDLNQIIEDKTDEKILNQLPEFVQDDLYRRFLYFEFLSDFTTVGDFFKF